MFFSYIGAPYHPSVQTSYKKCVCVCVLHSSGERCVCGGGVDMCEGGVGGKITVNYALHLFDSFG